MIKNKLTKTLLAFLLLIGVYSSANAQTFEVMGRVVDKSSKAPIEYAVVKVLKTADSSIVNGAISDENGFFKVEKLPAANYFLEITSIGYRKMSSKPFELSTNVPSKFYRSLGLTSTNERLKEAKVSGQRDFTQSSIDRKTYTVEEMAMTRGSNVSEVLELIPSVDVDIDGNISLRGSSNLTILIDGKPTLISNSDLHSLLETLPANSVKKIEVITNPSAKYDPDGMAGIINIVTKKNKLEGFFGSVNLGAAYNGRYNAGGMINIKQGKWSAMVNAGISYSDRFSEGSTFRRNINDTVTILDQDNFGNSKGYGGRGSFSLSYQPDKSSSITFSTSQSLRIHDHTDAINYTNSWESGDPFSIYSRNTSSDFSMNFGTYKVDYSKDFKGEGHNLQASVFTNTFEMDIVSEFEQGLNELNPGDWNLIQQRNNTEANSPSLVGQIDYVKPLTKNNQLELGAKSINKNGQAFLAAEIFDTATGIWVREALWSNDYQVDEGIHSMYAVYKQNVKKFGYQVGLRIEKAFTDAYLLESGDTFHNEYFSPFPSVHLSYQLKPAHQLKASYSRRVNRPHHRAMRPFSDYSDPLNVRKGNPFLLPEYINSYEVEHQWIKGKTSLSTSMYLKEISGMITRVKTVEGTVATTSWQNLGSGRNYGLEFILSSRPNRNWRLTFSGNAYKTEIDGGADSELNADGYMMSTKLLTSYRLPYSITVQLSGRYSSPRVLPQGEISSIQYMDFALSKRMLKNKATLNFKISDMFNTRQFGFITEGEAFYQDSYRKRESRFYTVTFAYSFGEFKYSQRKRSGSNGGEGRGGDDGVEID